MKILSKKIFNFSCLILFLALLSGSPAHLFTQQPEPSPLISEEVVMESMEETENNDPLQIEEGGLRQMSYWKEFSRMMMILGCILGVVLILAWLLRGFLNKRVQLANESNLIKILERRNLSQKSMIYLIEVHGKQFLIGDSAAGGVEYLTECPKEQQRSTLTEPEDKASKTSFMEILQRKLSEKKPNLLKLKNDKKN